MCPNSEFRERIDTLDLIINVLKEHEKILDGLAERLEVIVDRLKTREAGGKEIRAWTLKRGLSAPEAGGVVHTDFKEKFIRAEVIPWDLLLKSGSWLKARELGLIKIVGKEYIVQDGDIIEFKI